MSQFYEILTVISPNESEEDVEAIIGGLRGQLITSGAEILSVDVWGKRRLAYPIKKFDEGTYVLIHAEGPPNLAADYRRHTSIRESILRELVVKLDSAHEAVVRAKIAEQGPEDEATAEAQLEAAEERAAEKLAQVTAPVTDAALAAGVEVVAATDLEAPAEEAAAEEAPAEAAAPEVDAPAEDAVVETATDEAAEAPVDEVASDDESGDDAGKNASGEEE
jgi:small subunit ribosomal protein S6